MVTVHRGYETSSSSSGDFDQLYSVAQQRQTMEVAATVSYAGEKNLPPRAAHVGARTVSSCGGGYYGSKTTELLQLPRAHNEKGVWTLIAKQMTHFYIGSFLVNLNNRVVAVGVLFIKMVLKRQKRPLFNIICLHFR